MAAISNRRFTPLRLLARLAISGANLLIFAWLALIVLVMYTNLSPSQAVSAGQSFKRALTTLACAMGLFAIYWAYSREMVRRIFPEQSLPFMVFIVTALTRLAWLFFFREINLGSDFALYMDTASAVLHTGDIPHGSEWYMAYAPYVVGYAVYLSLVMRVFGEGLAAAQGANLVLSSLCAVLLYLIGKKIVGKPEAGLAAAGGWALLPAAAAMTSFPSTELPFITLMLAAIYAGLRVFDHRPGVRWLALACAAGAVILMNEFRPLGLVVVIAFCAAALIGLGGTLKARAVRGLGALALALVYLAGSAWLSGVKEAVIGREIARNPFGFGLFLGLNYETNGTWNEEDAEYTGRANLMDQNVQEFQSDMTALALERLQESGRLGRLPRLFFRKVCIFWSNPNAFIDWTWVMTEDGSVARKLISPLGRISKDLYGALLLLSLVEVGSGAFQRDYRYHLRLFLVKILLIGFFLSLVIFDNNSRYIAPALPLFCILAAGGVTEIAETLKGKAALARLKISKF